MEVLKNYTPDYVEFKLPEEVSIPTILGEFITDEEAREFVAKSFVATQSKVEAIRFMDDFEINTIREEYQQTLEDVLPELESKANEKHFAAEQAKTESKNAENMVKMANTKIRDLAKEAKAGITEMNLDNKNTWRIPLEGKYYYFTFLNNQLKLAKVKDIPDYEKQDLLNSMNDNKSAFAKLLKLETA